MVDAMLIGLLDMRQMLNFTDQGAIGRFDAIPWRRAFFGGPLKGWAPVRYIYVDEAGTSANEPVTVVVGIILHADRDYARTEEKLARALESVPEKFRKDFVFHAKSIWADRKYRDGWSRQERLKLLYDVMSIPRLLNLPVAMGMVRRNSFAPEGNPKITKIQFQHAMAFYYCISRADNFIRDHGEDGEVATIVAEDTPGMHKFLRKIVNHLKDNPHYTKKENIIQNVLEKATGIFNQKLVDKVERVKDTVHFVEKKDGPLLQIADACAFAFRRFFAEESWGEEFVWKVIGRPLFKEDYTGPASGACFYRDTLVKYAATARFASILTARV
jgi:Protein of unknown function (DUF3800)